MNGLSGVPIEVRGVRRESIKPKKDRPKLVLLPSWDYREDWGAIFREVKKLRRIQGS